MLEHDTVHEPIAADDHEIVALAEPSAEQASAETLSTPSIEAGSTIRGSHSHILKNVRMSPEESTKPQRPIDLLADAKRYRKRAQSAENELEKLRIDLAEREKNVAELTRTVQQERTRRQLELQLRDAGAVDLDAALALAQQSLAAKSDIAERDVEEAVIELQRMRPWLFRSTTSPTAVGAVGVMSASGGSGGSSSRAAKLENAAGDAIATGARTDLLRYLRLRRSRKR